jgi:ABC-type nitrate/sulfonate/bicarbonate transport system permease component
MMIHDVFMGVFVAAILGIVLAVILVSNVRGRRSHRHGR